MICKAIETKYLPATNCNGARYKATLPTGKSLTMGADYDLNPERNHAKVAHALIAKMGDGWLGVWVQGGTKAGYVFVKVT